MKQLSIIFFLILVQFSCDKIVDDLEETDIEQNWLFPVISTQINYSDIEEFIRFSYEFSISTEQLNIDNAPNVVIPPFQIADEVGTQAEVLPNDIKFIEVDSFAVEVSFENTLPIEIGAGTNITVYDSNSGESLAVLEIDQNIEPEENYSFIVAVKEKTINKDILIVMNNFNSSGSNGNIVDVNSQEIVFNLEVKILNVSKASISANAQFSDIATLDYDLNTENVDLNDIEGKFYMFIENALPTNTNLKIEVLNEAGNVTYTFFENYNNWLSINAATTDANGASIETYESGKIDLFVFDNSDQNFEKLANGKALRISTEFETPNNSINDCFLFTNEDFLNLQITADLIYTPTK